MTTEFPEISAHPNPLYSLPFSRFAPTDHCARFRFPPYIPGFGSDLIEAYLPCFITVSTLLTFRVSARTSLKH